MRVRQIRIGLTAAAAACAVATAGTLTWGIAWPCAVAMGGSTHAARNQQSASANRKATIEAPTFDSLVANCKKKLQTPLREDPAAVARLAAEQAQQKKAGVLAIVLVGTMIEDGFSRAMFTVPPNTIELKGVGEMIGVAPATAELVRIERNQVVVRYQGQLVTLRLKGGDEG